MAKYLRQTPTNSSNDSKGNSMGLEGDLFLFLIAGVLLGVILMIACMKSGMSPGLSIITAILPMPFIILFLYVFKIGKPKNYQGDLMQKWMGNTSITRTKKQNKNPYLLAKQGKGQLKSKTYFLFK
jgi:hypothetical protein